MDCVGNCQKLFVILKWWCNSEAVTATGHDPEVISIQRRYLCFGILYIFCGLYTEIIMIKLRPWYVSSEIHFSEVQRFLVPCGT